MDEKLIGKGWKQTREKEMDDHDWLNRATDLDEQHKAALFSHELKEARRKDRQAKLITIEGNIGAGKSTLTKALADHMRARAFYEPVGDNPFLEKYYQDPKRYGLEMQFWLMSRRFEMHGDAICHIWRTGQSVIMDRSIYGDWVFAKKNWLDGNIDDAGYQSYLHHRKVMNQFLMAPHTVLYLDCTPSNCFDRIQSRGRSCEWTIPMRYLEGLEDLHRELLLEMERRGSKVVRLNWNEFPEELSYGMLEEKIIPLL